MATGLRTCRKAETSVLSMVHPGRPCLHCTLCKEKYPVYTHPIKWKNEHLYTLLRELEPNISIQPESCVCRNCRDDLLRIQHAGPTSKGARPPRWAQQDSDNNIAQSTCEIPDCSQLASTLTKLRPWAEICSIRECDSTPYVGMTWIPMLIIEIVSSFVQICNQRQFQRLNCGWQAISG